MKNWLTEPLGVPRWLVVLAGTAAILQAANWLLELMVIVMERQVL